MRDAKPGDVVVFKRASPFYSDFKGRGYVVAEVDGRILVESKKKDRTLSVHPSHVRIVGSFEC